MTQTHDLWPLFKVLLVIFRLGTRRHSIRLEKKTIYGGKFQTLGIQTTMGQYIIIFSRKYSCLYDSFINSAPILHLRNGFLSGYSTSCQPVVSNNMSLITIGNKSHYHWIANLYITVWYWWSYGARWAWLPPSHWVVIDPRKAFRLQYELCKWWAQLNTSYSELLIWWTTVKNVVNAPFISVYLWYHPDNHVLVSSVQRCPSFK